MKAFLLVVCIGIALPAYSQTKVPTPSVTAFTSSTGKVNNRSRSTNYSSVQTTRATKVSVSVRYTSPPKPYTVQCFFLAKDEGAKERYVYDIAEFSGVNQHWNGELESVPVTGTLRSQLTIPFSGNFSGVAQTGLTHTPFSGTFSGSSAVNKTVAGAKPDGWIVRVVSEGQVVHVSSSIPVMADFAKKNPDGLNSLAPSGPKAQR